LITGKGTLTDSKLGDDHDAVDEEEEDEEVEEDSRSLATICL
jgi:hypothetical protein